MLLVCTLILLVGKEIEFPACLNTVFVSAVECSLGPATWAPSSWCSLCFAVTLSQQIALQRETLQEQPLTLNPPPDPPTPTLSTTKAPSRQGRALALPGSGLAPPLGVEGKSSSPLSPLVNPEALCSALVGSNLKTPESSLPQARSRPLDP